MNKQDEQPEYFDILAEVAVIWPFFDRLQSRLRSNRHIQSLQSFLHSRSFRRGATVGIVVLFLAFFGLGVYRNLNELQEYEWRADFRYILLAFAAFPFSNLPTAWCWHWIVRRVCRFGKGRINTHIFYLSNLGYNMPGAIWYVAGRVYWYRDHGVSAPQVIVSIAWEVLLLISSGLIVYVLLGWQQVTIALLLAIVTTFLYPFILNRLIQSAQKRLGTSKPASLRPLDAAVVYGAFGVAWLLSGVMLWWVINAITPVSIEALPSVIAMFGLAGAASAIAAHLVGGWGIRELTLSALLSQLLPIPMAVVAALVFRLVLTVGQVFWSLIISGLTRPRGKITQKG